MNVVTVINKQLFNEEFLLVLPTSQ